MKEKVLRTLTLVFAILSLAINCHTFCRLNRVWPKSGEVVCTSTVESNGYTIRGSLVTK